MDVRVEGERPDLPRASTWPPTGSSRRRSPTSAATPGRPRATVTVGYERGRPAHRRRRRRAGPDRLWPTGAGRPRPRRHAGTGRPLRRTLETGHRPGRRLPRPRLASPWPTGAAGDPGRGRRRPAPRPGRLRHARRPRRRPRARRRGGRRRAGGGPGRDVAARRRPDGHPHAPPRRDRGHPADHRRPPVRDRPGHRPDHLRPGRVRVRRPAGGRQRLPAQGRTPEDLVAAIRVVAAGDALLAPQRHPPPDRALRRQRPRRPHRPDPLDRSPTGSGRSWAWSPGACRTRRSPSAST